MFLRGPVNGEVKGPAGLPAAVEPHGEAVISEPNYLKLVSQRTRLARQDGTGRGEARSAGGDGRAAQAARRGRSRR